MKLASIFCNECSLSSFYLYYKFKYKSAYYCYSIVNFNILSATNYFNISYICSMTTIYDYGYV